MKIYSVKILFKYDIEGSNRSIYEESLRLFHAESFDEALDKAKKIAFDEEWEYINVYARQVKYRFYKIVSDYWLFDELEFEDGTEVFSEHFEMKSSEDDPIEKRYNSCSIKDMYIIRQAEFNGLWVDYEPED